MREIKFRAWSKEDKCWIVDSLFIASDGVAHASVGNYFPSEIEPLDNVILMQYTGLKDKNGVEIYEGDILKIIDNKMLFSGKDVYEVKYRDGYYENFTGFVDSEIIGNLYENPELIK